MTASILSAAGTIVSVAVGVVAAGLVVFAIVYHAVRKKQGKSGCDCGCSGCAGCTACGSAQKQEEKNK